MNSDLDHELGSCWRCGVHSFASGYVNITSLFDNSYRAALCLPCQNAFDEETEDLPELLELVSDMNKGTILCAMTGFDGIDRTSEMDSLWIKHKNLQKDLRTWAKEWIAKGV